MAKCWKHLALLIPNTDTTLEADLTAFLPDGWIYHSSRMQLDEVGEEAEKKMVDQALPQALNSLRGIIPFDAAVFGCTSASAAYGEAGLIRLHNQIRDSLGCPAYSAFAGVRDAILAAGNPPIALLTPYIPQVNTFFVETLNSFGVHVVYQDGLGLAQDPEIAAFPEENILEFAQERREAVKASGAQMVLFSCTNWRAAPVRESLERLMGLPVITSNQCILRWIEQL